PCSPYAHLPSPPLSLSRHDAHPALHSFPTRRSSDLLRNQGRNVGFASPFRDFRDLPVEHLLGVLVEDHLRFVVGDVREEFLHLRDRKSTRLNSSHVKISYAVFCLKKKNKHNISRSYA